MVHEPITDEETARQWIAFLEEKAAILDGKYESMANTILQTDEGDVKSVKGIVGLLLATLTNQPVEIN